MSLGCGRGMKDNQDLQQDLGRRLVGHDDSKIFFFFFRFV